MVALASSRRGGSTLGCLLSLALFLGAAYYGVHIGEVYLRFYRLQDAMRFQAQMAPNIDNGVIGRRLAATADSILGHAPRFRKVWQMYVVAHYAPGIDRIIIEH